MYPLHSIWMVEHMIDRPRDIERLDRIPAWARPPADPRPGMRSRSATWLGGMRIRLGALAQRGSLGPLPNQCAGDPAGPRW